MPNFNAEQAALLFPVGNLGGRLPAPTAKICLARGTPEDGRPAEDLDFSEQVLRVVRALVAVRRCSLDAVAAQFSMNRRRMNRMLEREGMTFHQISQKVLRTLAERLMLDTDMTLGRISAVLNYSEASVFTRAFRRWHGCHPASGGIAMHRARMLPSARSGAHS